MRGVQDSLEYHGRWVLGVAVFWSACHATTATDLATVLEVDAASDAPAPNEVAAPEEAALETTSSPWFAWTGLGTFPVSAEGRTEWIEASYLADPRYVAVRVRPQAVDPPSPWCYRLEPIELASGAVLVEPPEAQGPGAVCTACAQRVIGAHGYGFFVFPNDGKLLPGPDRLRLRVQLRDCVAGTLPAPGDTRPAEVVVEVAEAAQVSPTGPGQLRVRLAIASEAEDGGAPFLRSSIWSQAWERARAYFALANVALELDREASIEGPPFGILSFDAGDPSALDPTFAQAMDALGDGVDDSGFVPLILVRCLRYGTVVPAELSGYTPRVPGGAPAGAAAGGVFLALGSCASPTHDPEGLGFVIAHEIGHYLGLYHSDEAAGAHRAAPIDNNLMQSGKTPDLPGATWSPAQVDVLRRHPDLGF
jgi:hypothetical protein